MKYSVQYEGKDITLFNDPIVAKECALRRNKIMQKYYRIKSNSWIAMDKMTNQPIP